MSGLGDAIRAGAKLRPQGFGAYFTIDPATSQIHSCAIGAAAEGIELIKVGDKRPGDDAFITSHMITFFNCLFSQYYRNTQCPKCDDVGLYLKDTITHLNDNHFMSRESIAEWLDSFLKEDMKNMEET